MRELTTRLIWALALGALALGSAGCAQESRVRGLPMLVIPTGSEPKTLSADPHDSAWKRAARVALVDREGINTPGLATDVLAYCTAQNLYVRFDCQDPDPEHLETHAQEIWNRDSVEIFIEPQEDLAGKPYHHVIVDETGTARYARYHVYPRYWRRTGYDEKWEPNAQVVVGKTADGWTCAIRLPMADLHLTPDAKQGGLWRLNFCRTRASRSAFDKDAHWSWSPQAAKDFQDVAWFGYAIPAIFATADLPRRLATLNASGDEEARPTDDPPPQSILDQIARWEPLEHRDVDGHVMPYRLLKPTGYDPAKRYPLVIFLHGSAERGSDNFKPLNAGVWGYADDKLQGPHPCFVMLPQCSMEAGGWADTRSAPQSMTVMRATSNYRLADQPSLETVLVLDAIDSVIRENPSIDHDRIYLTGSSMGGFGTWELLMRRPTFFAAAVVLCGGGDETRAALIAKVPVWDHHGVLDAVVKVQASRNMIAALRHAGGNPRSTEYPDRGHSIGLPNFDPEVVEWMFAQKRSQ
jgi:predicted esterase